MLIIFRLALMSLCHTVLQLGQDKTENPLNPLVLIIFVSERQRQHFLEVLNSLIVQTITSPSASRLFKALKYKSTIPCRNPLNVTWFLLKTPSPKITKGTLSLNWSNLGSFHLKALKKRLTLYS